jgi:hypothetical protein
MASAAKVSSLSSSSSFSRPGRAVAVPEPRRARWGWLQLLRESIGGALLLAVWLALWTVTWAAVAGPLSPAAEAGAARARAAIVEGT